MISLRAFLLILLCSHCLFVSTLRTLCAQVDEVVVPQTPQAEVIDKRSAIPATAPNGARH
jgi:hypothetical protein